MTDGMTFCPSHQSEKGNSELLHVHDTDADCTLFQHEVGDGCSWSLPGRVDAGARWLRGDWSVVPLFAIQG